MQEVFEKIVEKLEEKIAMTWKHDYEGGRKDAFNEAIEIVRQEAGQYNGGWIPCSEQLPENDENILITDSNGKVRQITFNRWLYDNPEYAHNIIPIAWQPLPQPFKKGE